MKLLILITTYNRPKLLNKLLSDIQSEQNGYEIDIWVANDGSTKQYTGIAKQVNRYLMFQHHGKEEYWLLNKHLYQQVEDATFDYVFQLPDDVRLVDDFFTKAIGRFAAINDPMKVCLNLKRDHRTEAWTGIISQPITFDGQQMYATGWVDMCYIANRRYFELLDYTLYEINRAWTIAPQLGSGVGMQISQRLLAQGGHMYQVHQSLITQSPNVPSQMNPKERKRNPNLPL